MSKDLEFVKDETNISRQKIWIDKLSYSLDKNCGEVVKNLILEGVPADPESDQEKFSDFTINAIHKMDTILPQDVKNQVLTDCACLYPITKIEHIKEDYKNYHSSGRAHQMLEEQFRKDLEQWNIPGEYKNEIIDRGWGIAGKKVLDLITVTKTPEDVETYFTTKDEKRRMI